MSWRSYFAPLTLAAAETPFNERIEVIESFGSIQLLVNGIVQTGTYTRALFQAGLRNLQLWHHGPVKQILVFGVGCGGIFSQLHGQYPGAEIIGVDIDPEIIRIAGDYFRVGSLPRVTLIQADARIFVRTHQKSEYDCIIVDIYTGNDVPEFVTTPVFLRKSAKLLRKNGSMMINYFSYSDQPEKSERVFVRLQKIFASVIQVQNRKNIFFYCRR